MGPALRRPTRLVPLAFLGVIAIGTGLMMLPVFTAGAPNAPFVVALFTATSAVSVTGLTVVDTATYWSAGGHVLITVLTQIGGFGIMALATLLGLLVSQRLGLAGRLSAQAESSDIALGEIGQVLTRVAVAMLGFEAVITLILAGRFWAHYDYSLGKALWHGLFFAVQTFNNAGFSLYSDSLRGFVGDWWICLPVSLGATLGAIGFPVLFELARERRHPSTWSMHTRLTVWGTLVLSAFGFATMLIFEWANPHTLRPLGVEEKVLAAFTQDTMARSGGFETVPVGAMNTETLSILTGLMFIGGGSASTAGGIKVSTFAVLIFIAWSEIRGEPDVVVGRRRIATATQRQAITVAMLAVALVAAAAIALRSRIEHADLQRVLFETASAFGTSGMTTGLTATLPASGQLILVVVMFVGRVGTITTASALALNIRHRRYRYPEERAIVG
ncbi:potassium transporter TrkG [Plantactinospora mayteni]|uniref:Potassium transporter Trk n=1 Tax=Plantactinospora mayteni TaxID=566021 RepID=A0ABQ4EXI0_9ACTN|nr:potassium transporter TrkG [Plantactinospora mayteni]GIG99368.1 potassium transporter Trk [Plantactinospora mayteni]